MLKTLSKFFEISLGELLGSSEYDFQQAIEPKTESEPIEPEPAVSDTESLSGKKISRPLLITAITILVLIMIAVAIGIYSRADQQPTMPFRVMNSRTVEDEVWGTTTEIGVYCKDKVNNYIMDLVSTYVETEWHEKGNYGGDAINTIIIYFYNDKSLAKDICPNADSYLFILNPEDISE